MSPFVTARCDRCEVEVDVPFAKNRRTATCSAGDFGFGARFEGHIRKPPSTTGGSSILWLICGRRASRESPSDAVAVVAALSSYMLLKQYPS